MSELRFQITMTLDGYVTGPSHSVENPLGQGGSRTHEWAYDLKGFREMHGDQSAAPASSTTSPAPT